MVADQPQLLPIADADIITLPNSRHSSHLLQLINIAHHNIVKLTATNYLTWKLQMEAILICYDLYKFIEGSHPCPVSIVRVNNVDVTNLDYLSWVRQDKLLFGTLVSSISSPLIPLIQRLTTSPDAWLTLANTYARSTCAHLKQIKDQIKRSVKGSQTISEYMQFIKCRSDELAALGKPMNHEDLIEKILDGLDDDYKAFADGIESRDTLISFDKLHEKLINRELSLQQSHHFFSSSPVTANVASGRYKSGYRSFGSHISWRPTQPNPYPLSST